MNYERIVQSLLDVGEEMLKCGAENFRLDDSLYRMCESYGFKRYDVFAIPSNIQITVETPDGQIITQVRHIEYADIDYDKLDYLNNLSRYICENTPDADEINKKLEEIMSRKWHKTPVKYLAGIMGGTGFAVMFGAGFADAIAAIVASIVIVAIGGVIGKREHNVLVYNAVLAFFAESVILASYNLGLIQHPDRVMIGIVMLLISGLGVTIGIREILQRDFISGFLTVANSFLGALGIACGIAVSMIILKEGSNEAFLLADGLAVQLASCTTACVGFALWFNIKGKQVVWAGVGAFFTWYIYAIAEYQFHLGNFVATLLGAAFVATFALVMARVCKAPSTIFLTASSFPLIPGPNLYYVLYGFVSKDYALVGSETYLLFETCIAIAVGFLIVDIIVRNLFYVKDANREYELRETK
ncbi:MAG: threonine/serine exporter family protein [Firmicutes bacterium]|nr:threonine/serine exporter family protein [Bacillota bacterium]